MTKQQSRKRAVKCTRCHKRFSVKGYVAHKANRKCVKEVGRD